MEKEEELKGEELKEAGNGEGNTMGEKEEKKKESSTAVLKGEKSETLADEDLGIEAFEKALDWTMSGKYKQKVEGREMVTDLIRGTVKRSIKKMTMSQTVVDFIQDEEDWAELEEDEGDDETDWNRLMVQESQRRSTEMQAVANERGKLLAKAYQVKDENVILNIRNLLLQRKVAEISIGRRATHVDKSKGPALRAFSSLGVDPKVRYRETLQQYGALRRTLDDLSERYEKELRVLREYRDSVEDQLRRETDNLQQIFRTEMASLRCGLTGKAMEGDELLLLIERKLATMKKEHIRYVHTSQRLKDTTCRIATLEMYGDHTKLDDYEQLFEDNQKLEERIEERGEVIVALREKAVRELQEAAHMRDMMHGTEEDIDALVLQLDSVDERLSRGRDAVAKAKRRRDEIRRRTKKLVMELELLAYPELLSHFHKLRKLTAHAQAWLRSLMRACAVQEECIRRVRMCLLDLSKRYRGIIPDTVLRMLQLQRRPKPLDVEALGAADDVELEALPSRFTFSF